MESKILICDDEFGIRESLRMILHDKYPLVFAEDGQQAVDLLEKEKIDLVLMDINMPRLSGIEALQRIKEIDPAIQVLILTGYGSLDTAIQAIKYGAFDYITKPFDMNDLLEIIEVGLQKRYEASQEQSEDIA